MAGVGDLEGTPGGLLERPAHPFDAASTFVLAAGGLRRLRGTGRTFLGYTGSEMFWKDVIELVHLEDRAHAESLVSEAAENPGMVLNSGLRLRDATGAWKIVEASVRNVVEAPGDIGLVLADLREVSADGHGNSQTPLL
jgi:hypothetical protein